LPADDETVTQMYWSKSMNWLSRQPVIVVKNVNPMPVSKGRGHAHGKVRKCWAVIDYSCI